MRKFIEKLREDKGFTLAELLIVVAIIAVLVAIAIPVFSSQLERSRDSVSASNMRSAYSEASVAMLTSNGNAVAKTGNITVAAVASDKQDVTVENVSFKGTASGWSNMIDDMPFTFTSGTSGVLTDAIGGTSGNYTLVFEFDIKNDSCSLKSATKA